MRPISSIAAAAVTSRTRRCQRSPGNVSPVTADDNSTDWLRGGDPVGPIHAVLDGSAGFERFAGPLVRTATAQVRLCGRAGEPLGTGAGPWAGARAPSGQLRPGLPGS